MSVVDYMGDVSKARSQILIPNDSQFVWSPSFPNRVVMNRILRKVYSLFFLYLFYLQWFFFKGHFPIFVLWLVFFFFEFYLLISFAFCLAQVEYIFSVNFFRYKWEITWCILSYLWCDSFSGSIWQYASL